MREILPTELALNLGEIDKMEPRISYISHKQNYTMMGQTPIDQLVDLPEFVPVSRPIVCRISRQLAV